jgi:hypothetical protein
MIDRVYLRTRLELSRDLNLFERIALILEMKDSSAGCGLGCPHSDEEYPRRVPPE